MRKDIYGKAGEALATSYLKKKKYKILELNYHNQIGEIDIIAKDKKYIVFIEVKTRKSRAFGDPLEAINIEKQHKIKQVAQLYLLKNKLTDKEYRFDVISILGNDDYEINHIENAFDFSEF